jgi:hypothetical protein
VFQQLKAVETRDVPATQNEPKVDSVRQRVAQDFEIAIHGTRASSQAGLAGIGGEKDVLW